MVLQYGGELSRRQTGGEHVGNLSVAEDRDLHGKDRLIAKRGGNQVRNRRAAGGEDLQMCLEMKAARQRCAPWHPAAHELLAAAVDQDDAGRAKDRGGRGDQLAEVFQITGLEARRLSQQLQGRLGVADVAIRGDDKRLGPRVGGISEAIGRLLSVSTPSQVASAAVGRALTRAKAISHVRVRGLRRAVAGAAINQIRGGLEPGKCLIRSSVGMFRPIRSSPTLSE